MLSCQTVEIAGWIGGAVCLGIVIPIVLGANAFSDYCESVARMQGRYAEIDSPEYSGEGYSNYQSEIFEMIWERGYLQFDDPTLRQRGNFIRQRYHMGTVWLVVVLLLFVVPALTRQSWAAC